MNGPDQPEETEQTPFMSSLADMQDWFVLDYERWVAQRAVRERLLALRLRKLMRRAVRESIKIAAGNAMAGATPSTSPLPAGRIIQHSGWVAREYKDEPRPPLARLVSRSSDVPLRVLTLTWLWGIEHVADPPPGMHWDACVALIDSGGTPTDVRRAVRRARAAIDEELATYGEEMSLWRQGHLDRKLAWVTPRRPEHLVLPLEIWSNGWYLALEKDELAWLLASYVARPASLRNAMRDRYFGFTKHVNGMAAARYAREHIGDQAVGALIAHLLEQLFRMAESRWPEYTFEPGELPIHGFRAHDAGQPVVVLETTQRLIVHRQDDVDFWKRDAGQVPLHVGLLADAARFEIDLPSKKAFVWLGDRLLTEFTDCAPL